MTLPGRYRHHPPVVPPEPPPENRARQSGPIDYQTAPIDAETLRLERARIRRDVKVALIVAVVVFAVVATGWLLLR